MAANRLDVNLQTIVFAQQVVEEVLAAHHAVERLHGVVDAEGDDGAGDRLVVVVVEEEAGVGEVHKGLTSSGGHGVEHQVALERLLHIEHLLARENEK